MTDKVTERRALRDVAAGLCWVRRIEHFRLMSGPGVHAYTLERLAKRGLIEDGGEPGDLRRPLRLTGKGQRALAELEEVPR